MTAAVNVYHQIIQKNKTSIECTVLKAYRLFSFSLKKEERSYVDPETASQGFTKNLNMAFCL